MSQRAVATQVFYDPVTFGYWSSPNVATLRRPTPDPKEEIPCQPSYKYFTQPRWLSNLYPYLAFTPIEYPLFAEPIFNRLNIYNLREAVFPVGDEKWALRPNIVTSWFRLERALLGLIDFLLKREYKTATGFTYLSLPSQCGYMASHKQEKYLSTVVRKTRNAFVTLTTMCSFLIAANISPADAFKPEPQWVTECREQDVHEIWLAELQRSFVCNFTPGFRAGAYVNGYDSTWARCFPAFHAAQVPLWIWWGYEPREMIDPDMLAYEPTYDEREEAKRRSEAPAPGQKPTGPTSPNTDESYFFLDMVADESQATLPGSGQQKGETPQEFMTRMNELRKEYLDRESDQVRKDLDKVEWDAELERVSKTLEEPTIGAAIFEWVKSRGGHLVRKNVPREQWKDRWTSVPPWCRRYYALTDEWDLDIYEEGSRVYNDMTAGTLDDGVTLTTPTHEGSFFHDDDTSLPAPGGATAGTFNVSGNDYGVHHDDASLPAPGVGEPSDAPPAAVNSIQRERSTYIADIHTIYGTVIQPDTATTPELLDVLRNRYGFLVKANYVTPRLMRRDLTEARTTDKILEAMSRIGVKKYMGSTYDHAVLDLYNFCVTNEKNPFAFPPLWDYHPDWRDQIINHEKFKYSRVDAKLHLIGMNDGKDLTKQWYLLALRNPCTVVQLFRENPHSHGEMVRSLIARGMPFATVKCLKREPPVPLNRKSLGLGIRSTGHKFDSSDFLAYDTLKKELLNSELGRAALMRGGIVWRLAKNVVKVKKVVQGPTALVHTQGHHYGYMGGFSLADDMLEQADEDVICGVYHVLTGKSFDIFYNA